MVPMLSLVVVDKTSFTLALAYLNCEKDDVEKDQATQMLSNIPELRETFNIHWKIGQGSFGSVYLASLKQQAKVADKNKLYAVKHLVDTRPTDVIKARHERNCLKEMGGKNHVIGLEYYFERANHVAIVMPYIPHMDFSVYFKYMKTDELRRYMHALLTALRHVHSFGVIHRDVKPSNFVYDRVRQRYALVDFGVAQHTQPSPSHQYLKRPREEEEYLAYPGAKRLVLALKIQQLPSTSQGPNKHDWLELGVGEMFLPLPDIAYSTHRPCLRKCASGAVGECAEWGPTRALHQAGTRGYQPPEVLFMYPHQGTAVDMWAAGVILLSVLCGRYHFFRPADEYAAMAQITALLGRAAMERTAKALGCSLVTPTVRSRVSLRRLAMHMANAPICVLCLQKCVGCRMQSVTCVCHMETQTHEHGPRDCRFPDSAFALASRLLEPDPRSRITAAEALRHSFFSQP